MKKQTIFNNTNYTTNVPLTTIDPPPIEQNKKLIHTNIVSRYTSSLNPNKVLNTKAPKIHHTEQTLPGETRRTLAQLRTNKCPLLKSYLHKIDPLSTLSESCPYATPPPMILPTYLTAPTFPPPFSPFHYGIPH